MNQTARNFYCSFKDTLCDDARCKAGACIPEREVEFELRRVTNSRAAAYVVTTPAVLRAAKEFSKEVLKARGIKPTKEVLDRLAKHPTILTEAQRRVEWANSN
jgi:hypothetical protein